MPVRPRPRPRLRRDRQRRFWSQIRAGESLTEASVLSGVPWGTCRLWFHNAGGMPPISLVPPGAGRFLTIEDREQIAAGVAREDSIRAIARSIDKQPSTVLRELRANMFHQEYRSRGSNPHAPRRRRSVPDLQWSGTGPHPAEREKMPPLSLVPPGAGRTPTIEDREQIAAGVAREDSIRAIARSIDKQPSTVLRELRANMFHQEYRSRAKINGTTRGPRPTRYNYSPHLAQRRADTKASRPKAAKLASNDVLHDEVSDRLKEDLSPEQIANRLRLDFADDPEMWVSHETIYQSLYVQGRGALRRDLTKHLRTGRTLRKPHRKPAERNTRIKDKIMISDRPAEVADRAVPGHWEGDLITGKLNKSAIGTLVERTSGFTMLLHLPDDHGALAVQEQMVTTMGRLPEFLRKTVTWDQGIEMSNHANITTALDMPIYFCDPH